MFQRLFDDAIAQSPPSAVDIAASVIRARRRTLTRQILAIGGAAVAVLALAAGAVVLVGEALAPSSGSPPTATASPAAPGAIDWYDPRDLEFYRQFRWDAVSLARPPEDLSAAVEQSTAVVLAQIVDVRATRRVGDPAIAMSAFVLRPVEVITGRLRPELAGVVEVEFFGLPADPAGLAEMRTSLPKGLALWFLRWLGEPAATVKPGAPSVSGVADLTRYTTVHPTMVFASGTDGVYSAFFLDQPTFTAKDAPNEALRLARLSELVADLRNR